MRNTIRFFRHWQNVLGLLLVLAFCAIALDAPNLAPFNTGMVDPYLVKANPLLGNPAFQSINKVGSVRPLSPRPGAPLGTIPYNNNNHLNVYYNLIWGTRSALGFGLMVAILTALMGVFIGTFAGFAGGWVNEVVMRITDAFLTFPVVVGVVLMEQLIQLSMSTTEAAVRLSSGGNVGLTNPIYAVASQLNPILLALVLFSWMPHARLTNGLILRLKSAEFVEAARALGASSLLIMVRHLIPNAISPSIVLAARDIGVAVLLQATFTYINLPGGSEWGSALELGHRWVIGPGGSLLSYWWVFFPITMALVLFSIGWNLLGDGLNEVLNPRLT